VTDSLWRIPPYSGLRRRSPGLNAAFNEARFLAEVHPDDATFIDMEGCKLMVVEEIYKVA